MEGIQFVNSKGIEISCIRSQSSQPAEHPLRDGPEGRLLVGARAVQVPKCLVRFEVDRKVK